MTRLALDFFQRPTELIAKAHVGQNLIIHRQEAIITETGAYGGEDNLASHAFKGPTHRSRIMFEKSGDLYLWHASLLKYRRTRASKSWCCFDSRFATS